MIEKTEINNQQTFINLTEMVENEICDSIDEEDFYHMIDFYGIDLQKLSKPKKNTNTSNIKKFNIFLNKCKKKFGIDIYQSVIYIEKKYLPFKKILDVLDSYNKETLKKEMSIKYKIKFQQCNLNKFLI